LWQNEPNPFRGVTRIRYALPVRANVQLEVFNLQGQRVATLVRGEQAPGTYGFAFRPGSTTADGRLGAPPAGVYFIRLHAGAFSATRKMLLVR
jgi:hypothetical protein